jgi:hypothetical protein
MYRPYFLFPFPLKLYAYADSFEFIVPWSF